MSLLRKLFGKEKPAAVLEKPPCPHTALVPRWDNAEDMGKADKTSAYVCTACDTVFTPEEASRYLGSTAR
jgi:hypothetical protein